jgi:hypothetical protein
MIESVIMLSAGKLILVFKYTGSYVFVIFISVYFAN